MKLICIIFSISAIWQSHTYAQGGFNNTYDFGAKAAVFKNCILVGDTIVITGGILPEDDYQWCAMLARFDTSGQLIDMHYYPDTMGDHFTQYPNLGLIKTSAGDYLMTGIMYSNAYGAIVKTDANGNLLFYRKYPDEKFFNPRKIHELSGKYLVAGNRQRPDFLLDGYLMELDINGNILWDKYYDDPGLDVSFADIWVLNSNNYVIYGLKNKDTPNIFNSYIRSALWFTDSLGNIQSQWLSPKNIESGVLGLQHLPNGNWLYCSRTTEILGPQDWGGRCKIVCRDSYMNLVWERTMHHATTIGNLLYDLKSTPDGNWIAVGHWIPFYSENPDSVIWKGGVLHKFSPDGDSIWTVVDTAFWHPEYGSDNQLGGVVVLPSGSAIAVGNSTNFYGNFKSWAWMIKVDKDGCVEPLCGVSGTEIPPDNKPQKLVCAIPNPANEFVNFQFPENREAGILSIYDVNGTTKSVELIGKNQSSYGWHTADLPNGIYFYMFKCVGIYPQTGRIVIYHN